VKRVIYWIVAMMLALIALIALIEITARDWEGVSSHDILTSVPVVLFIACEGAAFSFALIAEQARD